MAVTPEFSFGRVVLFGGGGYIGRKLVEHFASRGLARVLVLADLVPPRADWLAAVKGRAPAVEISAIHCDVRSPIAAQIGAESADWIINLAAIHREPGHPENEYFDTNIPGARNICAFAEQIGCSNIVFTSSIAVYGRTRGATDEHKPLYPDTPYGISKLCAELVHEGWLGRSAERKLVVVRPGVVYGPGDPGNILRMIKAIKKGLFVFPGNPNIHKSYAYVFGLVESVEFTMRHSSRYITYNYVEKTTETLAELARISRRRLAVKSPILRLPNGLLQLVAAGVQVVTAGKSGIHPARVRKAAKPSHIIPKTLVDLGFEFRFDFASSLDHWMTLAPEDF